jgi:hypothetical protein
MWCFFKSQSSPIHVNQINVEFGLYIKSPFQCSGEDGTKAHFTLRPSVKKSRNFISGEWKFVHTAFTLEAKQPTDKDLQKVYMITFFGSFGSKSLFGGGKLVHSHSVEHP